MKVVKKLAVGSGVFFRRFKDYEVHDIDYVCIVDHYTLGSPMRVKIEDEDLFLTEDFPKERWLYETVQCGYGLQAGKFLCPDIINHLHLEIEDLERLKECIDRMDDRHHYLQMIYQFYLDNRKFELTEEQLLEAYNDYKKTRPERYGRIQ